MGAALIALLRMLASFGGGMGASALAGRYAAPTIGKGIGRMVPSLLGAGKGARAARAVGRGGLGMGAFFGGMSAVDALTGGAQDATGGEPPTDDTVDDVYRMLNQPMPFQRDQMAGLQEVYNAAEMRDVLEMLGVDFDEFSELIGGTSRGLV